VRDNSPAEIKAFDATCERLAGFNPEIGFEWVDGFLAALAAGVRLPEPEQWLPLMCGDAFERAFADPPDAAQANAPCKLRLKVLRDQLDPTALMDDPESLRLNPGDGGVDRRRPRAPGAGGGASRQKTRRPCTPARCGPKAFWMPWKPCPTCGSAARRRVGRAAGGTAGPDRGADDPART
jgi:hypothetical protein